MTDKHTEIWKDVKGYNGNYQVSDRGRIRSNLIPTRKGTDVDEDYHILQPFDTNSSPRIYLINRKTGNRKCEYIAGLILKTFVGDKPNKDYQAIRIDSDIANIKLTNLKWGERSEVNNILKQNGLMVVGEDLPQHKLMEFEVKDIKAELINGWSTLSEIAESYGVSWNCIWKIKENKNWKHVQWPDGEINEYTFRECKFCGDQFKTERFVAEGAPKKYCTDQCHRHQNLLVELGKTRKEHFGLYKGICDCCGENYEVDLSVRLDGKKPDYFSKKYCSKKCVKRQSYLNSVGKTYNEVYGTVEKECAACGQLFELGPDDYKGQKYCHSKECDKERKRSESAKRRWNGKGYWDREGKNDRTQRNYT